MLNSRLKTIFSQEELSRLIIQNEKDVIVDVHGMSCLQAKRFINNIINVIQSTFNLIIIHGYNHGTAIKDMLNNNFQNPHVSTKYPDKHNQGITHMLITV